LSTLGVILAGGLGRRMGGRDKAFLRLGEETLLARVMRRLSPQVDALVVNANGDAARFGATGVTVVPDGVEGNAGPLAGVLAGMDHAAATGHDWIVTVAVDTPFFPTDLAARLGEVAHRTGAPVVLAATPDPVRGLLRHPTFGLWRVDLRDDLRAALGAGVRKVVAWTDRHDAAICAFPAEPFDPFFNINRPEDLERAKEFQ